EGRKQHQAELAKQKQADGLARYIQQEDKELFDDSTMWHIGSLKFKIMDDEMSELHDKINALKKRVKAERLLAGLVLQSELKIDEYLQILKGRVEKQVNKVLIKKKAIAAESFREIIQKEWERIDKKFFVIVCPSSLNEVIEKNGNKISY
ncbi:24442_t:CDS:2, partial [Entrophospora sp. SA101]